MKLLTFFWPRAIEVTKGSEEAPRRGLDTKETDYCFGASFCISFGMKGLILPILQQ